MSDAPVDEVNLEWVRRTLLDGGECPYWPREQRAGFVVERDAGELVTVRWCVPPHHDDGARLSYLESYASLLRGAGIRALVTLSAPEARVVCLVETDGTDATS